MDPAARSEEPSKVRYPETKKVDHADDYHGTKVPDPYRWLEDDVRKSKDVADWVEGYRAFWETGFDRLDERLRDG